MNDLLADQPLGQKLITKSFWLYFFTAIILPTGYLVKVMASQSLSVEEVGLLYTIIGFVGMLSAYNDLGLTNALVYFIPKYRLQKKYSAITTILLSASAVQMITTVGICALLWWGGERLATVYFKDPQATLLLQRFVFYFIGVNAFQLITAVFRSFQDVTSQKILEAVKMWSIVAFAAWVFFISGSPSIVGFGTAWVIGMLLSVAIGIVIFMTKFRFVFAHPPQRSQQLLRTFGSYSLYTFLAMNATVLFGQVDLQMVNFFLGNEMAGYYTNFISLYGIATLTLSPLGILIYPLFTELLEKKDTTGVRQLIELYYHQLLLILLSASAFLFVFGPQLAVLLFGEGWAFSGELLRWYMPFLRFYFLSGIHLTILGANGQAKMSARIIWIGLFINIIVNYLGMQLWGVYGAIAGLVVGSLVMWLLSLQQIRRISTWQMKGGFWGKNGIVLLGLIILGMSLQEYVSIWRIIANIPIVVILIGSINRYELQLAMKIMRDRK